MSALKGFGAGSSASCSAAAAAPKAGGGALGAGATGGWGKGAAATTGATATGAAGTGAAGAGGTGAAAAKGATATGATATGAGSWCGMHVTCAHAPVTHLHGHVRTCMRTSKCVCTTGGAAAITAGATAAKGVSGATTAVRGVSGGVAVTGASCSTCSTRARENVACSAAANPGVRCRAGLGRTRQETQATLMCGSGQGRVFVERRSWGKACRLGPGTTQRGRPGLTRPRGVTCFLSACCCVADRALHEGSAALACCSAWRWGALSATMAQTAKVAAIAIIAPRPTILRCSRMLRTGTPARGQELLCAFPHSLHFAPARPRADLRPAGGGARRRRIRACTRGRVLFRAHGSPLLRWRHCPACHPGSPEIHSTFFFSEFFPVCNEWLV